MPPRRNPQNLVRIAEAAGGRQCPVNLAPAEPSLEVQTQPDALGTEETPEARRELPTVIEEQVLNQIPNRRSYRGTSFDEYLVNRTDREPITRQIIWVKHGHIFKTKDEKGRHVPIFHAEYDPSTVEDGVQLTDDAVRQTMTTVVDEWLKTGQSFTLNGNHVPAILRRIADKLSDPQFRRKLLASPEHHGVVGKGVSLMIAACRAHGYDPLV